MHRSTGNRRIGESLLVGSVGVWLALGPGGTGGLQQAQALWSEGATGEHRAGPAAPERGRHPPGGVGRQC